ncbi:MAG TPA: transposase [Bryobacteraceae bacterium]|jgi:REP element-mobilizing transposase RayT|nr:transposase [Bryobacteraceae bacterium]
MGYYERRLPHCHIIGEPLFVTFRLHGSLPTSRVFPPSNMNDGETFAAMDRLLDHTRTGPMFLAQPEIAQVIVDALHDGERRFNRYQLHSYVVMANHVHILTTPTQPATQWLGALKGFTAHRANYLLGRGGSFWQDESYDHLVRDSVEFDRIRRYIENNPVRAGLVPTPEAYPWSSAFR